MPRRALEPEPREGGRFGRGRRWADGWWGAEDGGAVAGAMRWAAGGSRAEAAAAAAAVRESDGTAGAAGPAAADGDPGRGGRAAAAGGRSDRGDRRGGPDRDLALAARADAAPSRCRHRLPGGPGRGPGTGAARRARLVDLSRSRPGRLVVRVVAGRADTRVLGAPVGGGDVQRIPWLYDLV